MLASQAPTPLTALWACGWASATPAWRRKGRAGTGVGPRGACGQRGDGGERAVGEVGREVGGEVEIRFNSALQTKTKVIGVDIVSFRQKALYLR